MGDKEVRYIKVRATAPLTVDNRYYKEGEVLDYPLEKGEALPECVARIEPEEPPKQGDGVKK